MSQPCPSLALVRLAVGLMPSAQLRIWSPDSPHRNWPNSDFNVPSRTTKPGIFGAAELLSELILPDRIGLVCHTDVRLASGSELRVLRPVAANLPRNVSHISV